MAYKIERDKKKHFFVGIPLGLLMQFICFYFFPVQPLLATAICFILLIAGCYGFELLSLVSGKGHADNIDAIAGIMGGMIGMGLYWSVHLLV